MKRFYVVIFFFLMQACLFADEEQIFEDWCEPKRVLHLSFHKGCINDFEEVARTFGLDVTSWNINTLVPDYFDPDCNGPVLYNMTAERAQRVFERHKDFFEEFDLIITSDTAPLSRIFLQNNWKKPLIIWVCNRFDYCDFASLDGNFPDPAYYELFRRATVLPNVRVIPYTEFERFYALRQGIVITEDVIKPSCNPLPSYVECSIPLEVEKQTSFFLPPYHNETNFMNLQSFLSNRGIGCFCGRYNGPQELVDFRAIIHLPYAWSTFAFFENMQMGIPYFVPTKEFLCTLYRNGNYFVPNANFLIREKRFDLMELYCSDYKDIITYFNSWDDLEKKIANTDFSLLRQKVKAKGQLHKQTMLSRWKKVFESFGLLDGAIEEDGTPSPPSPAPT